MSSIAFKLFRNRDNAFRAQKLLQSRGLETGLLVSKKVATKEGQEIDLPETGSAYVQGILTSIAQTDDPLNSLRELLGIPPDVLDYYKFGLATHAILLAVSCSEEEEKEISRLLREIDTVEFSLSPGFSLAGRTTETNPLDEKMTGEFRKY